MEEPRHHRAVWEARHPQALALPGDNRTDRVDDTRSGCAQLGDIPVELDPTVRPDTALTCDNGRQGMWSRKSWPRCPFTGQSPGGQPVALSTKRRGRCFGCSSTWLSTGV